MVRFVAGTAAEWEHASATAVVPLRATGMPDDFHGELQAEGQDAGLAVLHSDCSPHRLDRSRRLIDESSDDAIIVQLALGGDTVVEQHGRLAEVVPGDLVMYDTAAPYTLRLPQRNVSRLLRLPRAALDLGPGRALDDSMSRVLTSSHPLNHVIRACATAFVDATDARAEVGGVLQHAVAGAARVLGGRTTVSPPPHAALDGLRRDVARHLADPALDATRLAELQRVSLRTVYYAFSRLGITPGGYVREQRLAAAARRLRSDPLATVEEVALATGFGDVSTFRRAFRRRYGSTPGRWRTADQPA